MAAPHPGGFFFRNPPEGSRGNPKKGASLPRDNRPVLARAQQGMIGIVDKATGEGLVE